MRSLVEKHNIIISYSHNNNYADTHQSEQPTSTHVIAFDFFDIIVPEVTSCLKFADQSTYIQTKSSLLCSCCLTILDSHMLFQFRSSQTAMYSKSKRLTIFKHRRLGDRFK